MRLTLQALFSNKSKNSFENPQYFFDELTKNLYETGVNNFDAFAKGARSKSCVIDRLKNRLVDS